MKVVIGIGCDRGTALETLETALRQALELAGLSATQIKVLASIDIKRDESALVQLGNKYSWPIQFYRADELAQVDVPNPSAIVRKTVGTPAVAEAAALLCADTTMDRLLIEKHKYRGGDGRNATISIAPLEVC